jgi:hypothetical protein
LSYFCTVHDALDRYKFVYQAIKDLSEGGHQVLDRFGAVSGSASGGDSGLPGVDPFGATAPVAADPFGATAPVAADPFGATAPVVADPFGATAPPVAGDPFGAAPATADPFGTPLPPNESDPFGAIVGGAKAVADAADPFGPPLTATVDDPFGPPSASVLAGDDPFGASEPSLFHACVDLYVIRSACVFWFMYRDLMGRRRPSSCTLALLFLALI